MPKGLCDVDIFIIKVASILHDCFLSAFKITYAG